MDKLLKNGYKAFKYTALRIGVFLLVLATPVGILMSFNANADERQEQEINYYEQSVGEKGLKLEEQRRNEVIQIKNSSTGFESAATCDAGSNSVCD
ncbi:hypothetical protein AN960_12400 [Bacillus sp. FJAT-25509]|uniref:hypothetical protein n=1 Tax=Bacillus sp. FJAT-25509 TaxID=1712029 RepID=UPI0006F79484|nr:hypothetical protein [Bacillus sp. FJAT-25509]KQL38774.1 hypothetical protein AN960_12400 [Bacillus sp. FJAT-25509]